MLMQMRTLMRMAAVMVPLAEVQMTQKALMAGETPLLATERLMRSKAVMAVRHQMMTLRKMMDWRKRGEMRAVN